MIVQCLGVPVQVRFIEEERVESIHGKPPGMTYGHYSAETNVITVNLVGGDRRAASTFIHELLEFITIWMGVDIGEVELRILEAGLMSFFSDPRNNYIIDWLLGDRSIEEVHNE